MGFLFYVSLFMFLLVSVFLCCAVLVQESKSLGLGASFGGDAGDSLFGTSTADVLKKITAWLGAFFLIGCILLSAWSEAPTRSLKAKAPVQVEELSE